jgi:hypothetical protein
MICLTPEAIISGRELLPLLWCMHDASRPDKKMKATEQACTEPHLERGCVCMLLSSNDDAVVKVCGLKLDSGNGVAARAWGARATPIRKKKLEGQRPMPAGIPWAALYVRSNAIVDSYVFTTYCSFGKEGIFVAAGLSFVTRWHGLHGSRVRRVETSYCSRSASLNLLVVLSSGHVCISTSLLLVLVAIWFVWRHNTPPEAYCCPTYRRPWRWQGVRLSGACTTSATEHAAMDVEADT